MILNFTSFRNKKNKEKNKRDETEALRLSVCKAYDKYYELYKQFKLQTIIFPGNVAEYERFRGYTVEVADLVPSSSDKRLFYEDFEIRRPTIYSEDYELIGIQETIDTKQRSLEEVIRQRVEALVNISTIPRMSTSFGVGTLYNIPYGLPVRKRN